MNRQPQGIPTGGQFASTAHPEATGVSISVPLPYQGVYQQGRCVLWNDPEGNEHPGLVLSGDGSEPVTVTLDEIGRAHV